MRYALPLLLAALVLGAPALADEPMNIHVTLKDHRFTPSEIHVPAGKPTVLTIKNEDATPEEFDSAALQIEKVITGGGTATVRLRPLGAGKFPFMGEYHSATAQGVVIAQ
jgi:Cupredoxin-like domain